MCVSIDIVVVDFVVADCSIDEVDCDGPDVGSDIDGKSVNAVVSCSVNVVTIGSSVGEVIGASVVSDLLSIVIDAEVGLCGSAVVSWTFGVRVD